MKKISLFLAGLMTSLAFVSCEDTEPRLEIPTNNNFLNTPPTAENFVYNLESIETINLTCSQPEYGVAVIPTYAVQVSLSEDFTTMPADEWIYNPEKAVAYCEIPFTSTVADMYVPAKDIAQGISTILGYSKIAEYEGRTPYSGDVYIRLRAYFPTLENDPYAITSNVIKLTVKSYATVREPGTIWLIGQPGGWTGPDASSADALMNWRLREKEDEIGSNVYYGTFEIKAGEFMFRFYSALTGWELDSWGIQKADAPMDIAFDAAGVYSGGITKGKGSYNVPGWQGGWVSITVDLNNQTVNFVKVDGPNQ